MRAVIALLVVLSLAACTSLADRKRSVTLQDATFGYAAAMRWGDFRRADNYRRLPDPALASPAPESLQHIRITSYQVNESRVSPAGDSAELDVVIGFYSDDSMKVTTLHDHQHWSYDADLGAWYITTPLPRFRTAH